MPRAFQSIRFRLSLAIAIVVFSVATLALGGVYFWQVNQLDEPTIVAQKVTIIDGVSGEEINLSVVFPSERQRVALELIEQEAYREALSGLRLASLVALGALFVTSFAAGYMLSGWTLGPVKRITTVANEIGASDLSRRIGLEGPDDELRAVADTFDRMLDRLQHAFEDQRRFVSEASHELRNPLAVAQANLELVLAGPDDEMRGGVEIAHRATGRMGRLVDGLLRQARADVPQLRQVRFAVGSVVQEVARDFAAAAAENALTVEVDLADQGAHVLGDPAALRQIVANLFANAIKFAPPGTAISVSTRRSKDNQQVVIEVADQGPGVAPEHQSSVFEPFWQANREMPGVGLGLNIVRQLVERFGGTVGIAAQLDAGATFVVRLPLVASSHTTVPISTTNRE